MRKSTRLVEYSQTDSLGRGTIFRCKGEYPYEDVVDFMVCETKGEYVCSLMVVSGYKSGSVFQTLPEESLPEGYIFGIKVDWLKANWSKWIYPSCPIEDVWMIKKNKPKLPTNEIVV